MRIADAWRLGTANIAAHKGRSLKVVIIVGLLFSVLIAAVLLLQGGKNAVYNARYEATDGKILLKTEIDEKFCVQADCDKELAQREISENIQRYSGRIIEGKTYIVGDIPFYALPAEVFSVDVNALPSGAVPAIIPVRMAAFWAGYRIDGGSYGQPTMAQVLKNINLVDEVRQGTLGKTLVVPGSEASVYIAGLGPASMAESYTSMMTIGMSDSLFALILADQSMGMTYYIAKTDQTDLSGWDLLESSEVWAMFPNAETAYKYLQDPQNKCSTFARDDGKCPSEYRYMVSDTASTNFGTDLERSEEYYQTLWRILDVVIIVLVVIAAIIMISTYTRVLAQNDKVVSLYHASGATKSDIRRIYTVYLLCVSALAGLFALILGVVAVVILCLIYATPLSQYFVLAFGSAAQTIWLIGWNWRILLILAIPLAIAPVCVWLNNRMFAFSNVARKLK